MEKVEFGDLKIDDCLSNRQASTIFKLKDGEVFKNFNPMYVDLVKACGVDLESRTLKAKPINNVPEIIVPKRAVYNNGLFLGYTMDEAKGVDFNTYDFNQDLFEKTNLLRYGLEHLKMEDIIKRGNSEDVVFPDFCTCDNIFIDENGNFSLIDYDGIQVGNNNVMCISTSLGGEMLHNNAKYKNGELYTTELDKKSLIHLYFSTVFNINLSVLDENGVSLDQVFQMIGLDDYDIMEKVWKTTRNDKNNEFLGEDVLNLANEYKLYARPVPKEKVNGQEGVYQKVLVRK